MNLHKYSAPKAILSIGVIAAMLQGITGCVSTPAIHETERSKYALLIPAENTSSSVTKINGSRNFSTGGSTEDVLPGIYEIEVWSCPYGSISGCWGTKYSFRAEAGKAYVFKGRSAEGIEVFDRFNLKGARLELLPRTPKDRIPGGNNAHEVRPSPEQSGNVKNSWTKINTTEVASGYVDWTSLQRTGGTVKIWTLNDMKFPLTGSGRLPYSSIKVQFEYDCKKTIARRLGVLFFEGNMATGQVRYESYDAAPWESITNTSQTEAFGRAACRR